MNRLLNNPITNKHIFTKSNFFTKRNFFTKLFSKKSNNILLGRWQMHYNESDIIKQNLANHDHCGCCGTPSNIKYPEELELKIKKNEKKKGTN